MTEWRTIPGYDQRYQVSDEGEVRSSARGAVRPIKLHFNRRTGRLGFTILGEDGRHLYRSVQVVVARAFHGPRPPGQVTRHLDGNALNNHATNLAYGTHKQNAEDAIRHGTTLRGARHSLVRLTEAQARQIKSADFSQWGSIEKLARELCVDGSTISDIRKGRTWKWLDANDDIDSRGSSAA